MEDLTYGIPTANFWIMIFWVLFFLSISFVYYVFLVKKINKNKDKITEWKIHKMLDITIAVICVMGIYSGENLVTLMNTEMLIIILGLFSMFSVSAKCYSFGIIDGARH